MTLGGIIHYNIPLINRSHNENTKSKASNQAFNRSSFNDNGKVDITQFKKRDVIRAVDKMLEWHIKEEAVDVPVTMYYTECLHIPISTISILEYIADRWRCAGRLMFLRVVMELY